MYVQLKLMLRSILLFTTSVLLPKTKFNLKWVWSIFIRINNEHINIIRIKIIIIIIIIINGLLKYQVLND